MKIKELIRALERQDQELQVRLVCNHGQALMECFSGEIGYIEEDSYMPDEIHPDDYNEEDYPTAQRVFVLAG